VHGPALLWAKTHKIYRIKEIVHTNEVKFKFCH